MAKKTFVVTYSYVPEMLDRRGPYRADHLERVKQRAAEGGAIAVGAFTDPVDGAMLLLAGENEGEILAWIADDPYTRAGLIRGITIREITLVVGQPAE